MPEAWGDLAVVWHLRPEEPFTVEFKEVWFRYADDQPYILRDVSYIGRPGERVAVIGENGAGDDPGQTAPPVP
jgi:ATP-binding cassette subfamily B protein